MFRVLVLWFKLFVGFAYWLTFGLFWCLGIVGYVVMFNVVLSVGFG